MEVSSQGRSVSDTLEKVLWGPAWVDGLLGRLIRRPDGSAVAETWEPGGWVTGGPVTIDDLLKHGVPARPYELDALGAFAAQ